MAFWHDFAHSILHFEGKIWRTLPLLAFHPGQLTRRYVHGERARFISPIAFFLFSVVLMFSVFSLGGSSDNPSVKVSKKETSASMTTNAKAELAKLLSQRAKEGNKPDAVLDSKISFLRGVSAGASSNPNQLNEDIKKANFRVNVGDDGWSKALIERAMKARENPELLWLKIEQGAHKYAWIIIPLSAPFLWLTFCWRRDLKMYDHIVFITYSVCFMMLLLVTMALIKFLQVPRFIRLPFIIFCFGVAPPLHIYKQLKGAYLLTRWGALWRTSAMLATALFVMTIYISIIVIMGFVN